MEETTKTERTEFGSRRSSCSCLTCRMFCEYAPGYLIPDDLKRMIPADVDILEWAEQNLRASPGAIAIDTKLGRQFRVPTLVPAIQEGSVNRCKFFENKRCTIHDVSPFGCAFFSCSQSDKRASHLTQNGVKAVALDWATGGMYSKIWELLDKKGITAPGPEETHAIFKQETSP